MIWQTKHFFSQSKCYLSTWSQVIWTNAMTLSQNVPKRKEICCTNAHQNHQDSISPRIVNNHNAKRISPILVCVDSCYLNSIPPTLNNKTSCEKVLSVSDTQQGCPMCHNKQYFFLMGLFLSLCFHLKVIRLHLLSQNKTDIRNIAGYYLWVCVTRSMITLRTSDYSHQDCHKVLLSTHLSS